MAMIVQGIQETSFFKVIFSLFNNFIIENSDMLWGDDWLGSLLLKVSKNITSMIQYG